MIQIVCNPLCGTVGERLDNFFQRNNGFVEVNPGGVIMPKKFQDICHEILDSHVRSDDVWMISYPRTGIHLHFQFIHTAFELIKTFWSDDFHCLH